MLSIGELDRRIIIESPTFSRNNYGEQTETWATLYTVWAKVAWIRSDEKEQSQEITNITDVIFYIRNLGVTILSTYRISWDSKYYYIQGIKEIDGREAFLELPTKLKDNE
mgnify:CR=1 FL=1|tara:strand:+ start:45 stop:374 length:330 start_codon:yes stop_codon:yes gene_type:complete